jgi:16S rRNA (uracil1498-N3)-methyltransferase
VKKFLLPEPCRGGPTRLTLGSADTRYLMRVLRMREGDTLPAADADGGRYHMTIRRAVRDGCEVEVVPATSPPDDPAPGLPAGPRVTLLQCLPKGRKIDLIVRQATETGVARIIPLVSAHTIVRPGEDDGRNARLLRVAREAVQQSGVPRLPLIEEPRELSTLADAAEGWGTALLFVERRGDDAEPLHRLLAHGPAEVSVLIGPEGGLAEEEIALLSGAGFHRVHLETGVLRVETAVTYALGAVMTILQERMAWKPAQDE